MVWCLLECSILFCSYISHVGGKEWLIFFGGAGRILGYLLKNLVNIGPVAQWIRHRPTEPGIAGLSPAGVIVHIRGRQYVRLMCAPRITRRIECIPSK